MIGGIVERALRPRTPSREAVVDGIRRCYGSAGLPWHGRVVFTWSPQGDEGCHRTWMSIERWADGSAVYRYHGITVPAALIESGWHGGNWRARTTTIRWSRPGSSPIKG